MGNQAEQAVIECLKEMDDDHREVLILRDVESLSYDEVSTITGLNLGTAKRRLHRARGLLKEGLERRLGERLK